MKLQKEFMFMFLVLFFINNETFAQIEVNPQGNVAIGDPENLYFPFLTKNLQVYGNIYGPDVPLNESSIVGFTNIIGRKIDGVLNIEAGVPGGLLLLNDRIKADIIMARAGGNVKIGALYQSNGRQDKLFVVGSIGATGGFWESTLRLRSSTLSGRMNKNSNKSNNTDAISYLNSLNGFVSNNTNDSKFSSEENTEYGFELNDEIVTKMPYAFRGDSKDGYQVNYNALVPLLVEGLKELNNKTNEIESLKKEIEELKELINKEKPNNNTSLSSEAVMLYQNKPNPYSKATSIKYFVNDKIKNAKLIIYDLHGTQKQSIDLKERGEGELEIRNDSLASGIYLYLIAYDGQFSESKKMILTD